MKRVKELAYKYRIILAIILLLVASCLVYIFVFASNDIYENQIKVSNTNVSITSGTPNFDDNDEPGNDKNATNDIVRNFDQVTYSISYDLTYKEDRILFKSKESIRLLKFLTTFFFSSSRLLGEI